MMEFNKQLLEKRFINSIRYENYRENPDFTDDIVTAIDKIQQAISVIKYPKYSSLNKETIEKLENIVSILKDIIDPRL